MNKIFDVCFWCKEYTDGVLLDNPYCRKFNIPCWERMESCDRGKPSELFYERKMIKPERYETGGTKESEHFE